MACSFGNRSVAQVAEFAYRINSFKHKLQPVQFLLLGMTPRLAPWRARDINPQAPKEEIANPNHDLTEVTLAQEPPGPPLPGGPYERLKAQVLAYDIFGPQIGRHHGVKGRVFRGDTIGLAYRFIPGLRLFFASRVTDVFVDESSSQGLRSGFVYQTLNCHPEVGEEIFEIRKDDCGDIILRIEAWSRPNLWYVKLFSGWARSIQKQAAQCAVEYLAQTARSSTSV